MNLIKSDTIKKIAEPGIKFFEKHDSNILFGAGMLMFAAGSYFTWRAGTKHEGMMAEIKNDISAIRVKKELIVEAPENPEGNTDIYTEKDFRRELAFGYGKCALKILGNYGKAIACDILGYRCAFKAFGIEKGRATDAIATCILTENAFSKYRKNLIEAYGQDVDNALRLGIKTKEVEEPVVDKEGNPILEEDGTQKTKKKKVHYTDGDSSVSMYSRLWSKETSTRFETFKDVDLLGNIVETDKGNIDYNLTTLKQFQEEFNRSFTSNKGNHVFLSDVYRMLGFKETAASRMVGWYYDPDDNTRDNFIDFGFMPRETDSTAERKRKQNFMNGLTDTILLDFNVDGNIMPLVFPEYKKAGAA